jgi:hypothetical protein
LTSSLEIARAFVHDWCGVDLVWMCKETRCPSSFMDRGGEWVAVGCAEFDSAIMTLQGVLVWCGFQIGEKLE